MTEQGSGSVKHCTVITGLSGSGKSTALHILEDQGMFSIDNIPARILADLVQILGQQRSAAEKGLAVVIDARDEFFQEDMDKVLQALRNNGVEVRVIFLDASEQVLLRRFETTRRRHPLASGEMTLLEGIQRERELLAIIRDKANICLDTSLVTPPLLRENLLSELGLLSKDFQLVLTSFGFKYGPPQNCDFLIDVRFLPNPFYVEDLKRLSGKNSLVQEYVFSGIIALKFQRHIKDLIRLVLPPYAKVGKGQIHFAFGCTGGRHRSVSIVEMLARDLSDYSPLIRHRDIDKDRAVVES